MVDEISGWFLLTSLAEQEVAVSVCDGDGRITENLPRPKKVSND